MDPDRWGPYGWKVIHSVSNIPSLTLESYKAWLESMSKILPCRKCRKNFKKHLSSDKCDGALTPPELGICLHDEVTKDVKKTHTKKYKVSDLPPASIQNIYDPVFWISVGMNKTVRKTVALRNWFRETERLLNEAPGSYYDIAADSIRDLQKGVYAPILSHTQEAARTRHLTSAIRKMLKMAGVREVPSHGRMVRILSITSGSHVNASKKRRHTDARNSRSLTRRRSRAAFSRISSE